MIRDDHKSQTIHFNRWTRKSWSLFGVIGRLVRIGVLAVIYLVAAEPALAQTENRLIQNKDPEDTDLSIEEIEVLGQRISLMHGKLARMVSIISQAEIARSSYSSVSELLDAYSFVDIRQRGPDGAQTDISLNGSSFEQILILVNGIPFNNPQSGHFNGDIPVPIDIVNHIEVFPGGASRWLGPLAYAGAVNIVTRGNNGKPSFLQLSSGQHKLFSANGATYFGKKLYQTISLEHLRHDGYIANTDLSSSKGFYSFDWKRKQSQAFVQAGFNTKRFGAQAYYSPKYPEQYEETASAFISASFRFDGRISFNQKVYSKLDFDEFHLFRYKAPEWYTGPNNHFNLVGGFLSNLWWNNALGQFTLGLDARYEKLFSSVLGFPFTPGCFAQAFDSYSYKAQRSYWNLYAEQDLRRDKWMVAAGLMSTISMDHQVKVGIFPGVDLRYQMSDRSRWFVSVNRSMRLPTFTELYYESPTNLGNPDLEPETGWSIRTGLSFFNSWYDLKLQVYGNYSQNEIDWIRYQEDEVWHAQNIATIFRGGASGDIRIHPMYKTDWNRFSIHLGYSYQHLSRVESEFDSRYILDYLKHKLVAGINFPVSNIADLSVDMKFNDRSGFYTDWNPVDLAISHAYQPVFTLDVKIQKELRQFNVWLAMQNLLNQPYMDIGPVLQPGRWVRFGIKMKFPK